MCNLHAQSFDAWQKNDLKQKLRRPNASSEFKISLLSYSCWPFLYAHKKAIYLYTYSICAMLSDSSKSFVLDAKEVYSREFEKRQRAADACGRAPGVACYSHGGTHCFCACACMSVCLCLCAWCACACVRACASDCELVCVMRVCLCLCLCLCARARLCLCACVRACACACVLVWVHACVLGSMHACMRVCEYESYLCLSLLFFVCGSFRLLIKKNINHDIKSAQVMKLHIGTWKTFSSHGLELMEMRAVRVCTFFNSVFAIVTCAHTSTYAHTHTRIFSHIHAPARMHTHMQTHAYGRM